MIYHILGTGSAYGFSPQLLSFIGEWGASGVHVFFVLSGFVMLHSQLQTKLSMLTFLKFRLIRIVPIYWLVTFVMVLSFALFPSTTFNGNGPSAAEVMESLFFLSSAMSGKWPALAVGWTLELEMLFYLVFASALMFSRWSVSYLIITLVMTTIAFMTSSLIILEFIFGMIAAYIYNNFRLQYKYGLFLAVFGFVLLLSSINQMIEPRLPRIIYWGVPSTLIVLGLAYSKQYNHPYLKTLGDASYSVYLVHVLSISVFYKISLSLSIDINYDVLGLLCLLTSVLSGVLLFIFVEKPLTKFIRSIFQEPKI